MKKFLYMIPVLLVILCATPFAIYKDTVNHGSSLDTASPSYWKISNLQLSFSGSPTESTATSPATQPAAYSDGATFKGFPFGAYFSRSNSTNTNSSSSNFSVSAWSWLWAGIDFLLIAGSLLFAIRANKRSKSV